MIKGLIIDVDGVVVGEKQGFNFPNPHPDVISRLKALGEKGVFVSLCTAKPHFSINEIITLANLRSVHITDGGGVIVDPLNDLILKSHFLEKQVAQEILELCLSRNTYVEMYTIDEYFAQGDQQGDETAIHADILQTSPHLIDSLVDQLEHESVTKIMPIVQNDNEMQDLDELLQAFDGQVTVSWGTHPVALPRRFGIITAQGISKRQATQEVAAFHGINMSELLGIGDSTSDWQYMEQCGYVGTVANASTDLKNRVGIKTGKSFIGKSVDENGIIDVLDHFGL